MARVELPVVRGATNGPDLRPEAGSHVSRTSSSRVAGLSSRLENRMAKGTRVRHMRTRMHMQNRSRARVRARPLHSVEGVCREFVSSVRVDGSSDVRTQAYVLSEPAFGPLNVWDRAP